MATHKHIDAICIVILAFILLLTILFMNGNALGIHAIASEEDNDAMFTENDLNAEWDTASATRITLSDEGSTVRGNGAYVYDGDVHIVYAGKYILSGTLSDGMVIIEADGDDKIWLMLDGVSIHCKDNAAILVEQAGNVFLTLQDGTENNLSSGASYNEEAISANVDGVIYSRDDLTINGAGTLKMTTEYQHGIVCNDDFVITGGTLYVSAIQDAIHANDSARFKDAYLTLSAGDDGITVSNDDETSYIYVESGNITIPSCCEGLEAVQITIVGGTLDIAATDDGLNANGYIGNSVINIAGGEITVTVENGRDADGIDSNKDINISGGRLFVSVSDYGGSCAIDCGSEYGGKCKITGGTVLACGSSGMAEGFDSSSTQGFLMQTVSAAAGTKVTVKDADGTELISEKIPCSFSSVLVSTPEMKVGDACTLIVGDRETEMIIDNASNDGGFASRGNHGGNGFDGGQMPKRGGFGRTGGAFGSDVTNETQDNKGIQNGNELSEPATTPGTGLLNTAKNENQDENAADSTAASNAQNGNTPPALPGNGAAGGMQSPEMQGRANGDTPPDFQQGGMNGDGSQSNSTQGGTTDDDTQSNASQGETNNGNPQSGNPQDGMNGNGLRPDTSQGERSFDGRFGGNMQNHGNTSQATDTGVPISGETLILLCVSALVLLVGCVIAMLYKRRG